MPGINIALDMGYGRIKICDSYDNITVIPTYIVKATADDSSFLNADDFIIVDKKKLYVGEQALNHGIQMNIIDDQFHGSLNWLGLMAYSLYSHDKAYQLKLKDNLGILCLGLPINQYSNKKKRAEVNKITQHIKSEINKKEYEYQPSKVVILPQGAGAYIEYISTGKDGSISDAVVDIGKRTVDCAMFKNTQFISSESRSFNRGVDDFHKRCATAIAKEFSIELNIQDIERAIEDEHIFLDGKEISISRMLNVLKADYTELLYNSMKEAWGDQLRTIKKFIFIGGGAEILKENLKAIDARAIVPRYPALANVKGYITYMTSMTRGTENE